MSERQGVKEPGKTVVGRGFEQALFFSRWLLAPFYLGLSVALAVLLYDFGKGIVELVEHAQSGDHDAITVGILALIDLSLMANLVLMVMFAGYESFVSKLNADDHPDRLDWMGEIGFGDLKLKLMTSLVAISSIRLLEAFMNVEHLTDRELAWTVGIVVTFVVSGLLLAVMERLMHK